MTAHRRLHDVHNDLTNAGVKLLETMKSNEGFLDKPRSIDEVAEFLGCTRRFLASEIAAGRLRARRLSARLIRIMPEDLRHWLDAAATVVVKEA